MFDIDKWKEIMAYFLFAALGGLLGHLLRLTESDGKITFWEAVIKSISAGFVGLLSWLVCKALGLSPEWTGVVVGMSGWMGATTTVRIIEVLLFQKLGLKHKRRKTDTETDEL